MDVRNLLRNGVFADSLISTSRLVELAGRLAPVSTQFPLIRVGGESDGGYLLPDDLAGVKACFSPGVANVVTFEAELQSVYGIPSHLCDYSVDGVPQSFLPKSFQKKFVGPFNDEITHSLDRWVAESEPENTGDLMIQMDIEGAEYATLLGCGLETLLRFRIIVVELHHLHVWGQAQFFSVVESLFKRVLEHFHVVHAHPNNNDGLVDLGTFSTPLTMELTLLRKDRSNAGRFVTEFPHPLDRRNNPGLPEMALPNAFRGGR
jgi:hypothetical protein